MTVSFNEFFRTAFGREIAPFDYQRRLACGERDGREEDQWLRNGAECKSRLINISTGCGKTAAVVLAWLWNRIERKHAEWPRRLVYCLPMRTLVEQTRDKVREWLKNLGNLEWSGEGNHARKIGVHILMGGEEKTDWDIYPERDAILIGTQDMLLSRSLNRGYGMSRYRWPMHFGLLNNDCLWVFDEIQLMGSGLPTTAQLHAFRNIMSAAKPSYCFWMSATLDRDWLKTVDFDPLSLGEPLKLPDKDRQGDLRKTFMAPKPITCAKSNASMVKPLAEEILTTANSANGLTLVVVNTVRRACDLHDEIKKLLQKQKSGLPLTLIHSRFRLVERKERVQELLQAEGKPGIVISTQVVEAGVDISAEVLFTELAPWSSLVQRFGRCNRRGKDKNARIFWIDLDAQKLASPYESDQLTRAWKRLHQLAGADASPAKLETLPLTAEDNPKTVHVIRSKDFVELFDTTPDLAGNDIDIDRYVRETDDSSVHIFWREWDGKAPPSDMPSARREELCPVPMGGFNDFVKNHVAKNHGVWNWDYLERQWVKADRIYPGQIYLLHASDGGYSTETGWNPKSKSHVPVLKPESASREESYDDDETSQTSVWQSIAEHTDDVLRELRVIIESVQPNEATALELAARWHDRGKAHEAFQAKIRDEHNGYPRPPDWQNRRDIAKAPGTKSDPGWWKRYWEYQRDPRYRKHFRHELASALAVLDPANSLPEDSRDLITYLVAAHHGKVRLSIRSLPDEIRPDASRRFARGVWDGDTLAPTYLGNSNKAPAVSLSLEPMELGLCEQPPFAGQPSWADRMLCLRNMLGPFRLAYLEILLRAADQRASAITSPAL